MDGNITILMEKAFKQFSYIQGIKGDNEGAEQIYIYNQKRKPNINITVHGKILKLYLIFCV